MDHRKRAASEGIDPVPRRLAANNGVEKAVTQWTATFDTYLSDATGHNFTMLAAPFVPVKSAV